MSDYLMTGQQLADKVRDIATNYPTLYVMGGFGAPATAANKARYTGPNANEYNKRPARTELILNADPDTFFFDCVGLAVKAPLWGWTGDPNRVYGGAKYESNGVPDIGADTVITRCTNVSTTFNLNTMKPGEFLWKQGHCGIYIGNGLAVECTPAWDDKVQVTACNCTKSGYHTRTWSKHGLLPWVDYSSGAITVNRDALLALRTQAMAVVAAIQDLLQEGGG
jgi:hypothetical protein